MLDPTDLFHPSYTSATGDSETYTSAPDSSLTAEATFTFAHEQSLRAYFNAGGGVGFSASKILAVVLTTQNTNWTDTLSAMGDALLIYNEGTGSSGTNNNIGLYELSTSYQTIWTKFCPR